jgi:hypothetical protein
MLYAKYFEYNTLLRGDHKKMTSVRDIGDKTPFDKASLEIQRQKTKRHVIQIDKATKAT